MATKKEWKDYLKAVREWTKVLAEWIRKKGQYKSADEQLDTGGDRPPDPPPKP